MSMWRNLTAASLAATAVAAGAVAMAAPASAAVYGGQCGAGYSVVDSTGIRDLGTVFLTYNPGNGSNCAVTIRNEDAPSGSVSVYIGPCGGPVRTVTVNGGRSAGPVYATVSGQEINWGGAIDGPVRRLPCGVSGAATAA
ncbi:spore-associated protein A [Marinactinospora rubrisoli]|uniref:Spore-associated protein A n=1 Tax=Marinactinospora rubrisoli TaxID=2715399 RepID=A0ABW2KFT2_9ACTN